MDKEYKVSLPLTTFAQEKYGELLDELVYDEVFLEARVGKTRGQWWDHGLAGLRLDGTGERAPDTIGEMSTRSGSWVTYATKQFSHASPITKEELAEFAQNIGGNLERTRTTDCMNIVLRKRERRLADLITAAATASFAKKTALAANQRWDNFDADDTNPVRDIRNIIKQMLVKPTHILAPRRVQLATFGHPAFTELIKTHVNLLAGNGMWGDKFLDMDVVTPSAKYLSNEDGQTEVLASMYPDSVVLFSKGKTVGGSVYAGWGVSLAYPATGANSIVETEGSYASMRRSKLVRYLDQGRCEKVLWNEAGAIITNVLNGG